jgi:hypothetical protein
MPETLGSGSEMLSFVKTIKPAARNRGIICHAGSSGIYLRDVVISPKAKWKDFGGYAHAVVGAYRRPRPGNETSANPPLSIFHLGKTETFDNADRNIFTAWKSKTIQEVETEDKRGNAYIRSSIRKVKLHPFSKKSVAYDFDGHWPLTPGNWNQLDDIKGGAYDIWAIRGESPEEIDVYTATGSAVRRYTEGGAQHIKLKRENPTTDSYKVGAVRRLGRRPSSTPRPSINFAKTPRIKRIILSRYGPSLFHREGRLSSTVQFCRPVPIWMRIGGTSQ